MWVDLDRIRTPVWSNVTELLKFRKLHFSRSISSAILACSSKLMVDYDNMGPGLQLVRAQFLTFLLSKLSHDFKLCRMSILQNFPNCLYCACWFDLDPIQGQGQGYVAMTTSPLPGLFLSIYVFSNHLIGRGQKSVWCVSVCMCVWTITFGQNNPWPRYLACSFNLTLSMLFSKVKVTGHSSGSQNEKCSFVGYGWILQGDCTFWIARCQHQTCTKCTVY